MKGKRAKQYRKLMKQYALSFNFREPYQVLVDAQMLIDASKFSMDLTNSLSRTLSGTVKPMLTQCTMRHLYALPLAEHPERESLIAVARTMERRRCGHHTLEQPLSTMACLKSVIDPKSGHTDQDLVNKFNYVVAVQDEDVRRWCRRVRGTPLVYVKRSVMVMEPMAEASVRVREGEERGKMKMGLRGKVRGEGALGKRKRGAEEEEGGGEGRVDRGVEGKEEKAPKKRRKGPKGPNPLSVMKPKKQKEKGGRDGHGGTEQEASREKSVDAQRDGTEALEATPAVDVVMSEVPNPSTKGRRKRKHKAKQLDGLKAEVIADGREESF